MSKIKYFDENINIENRTIVLRADLNVPIISGKIQDLTRVDQYIAFIRLLLEKKAKVILISHLGRPKSKNDKSLSLKPVFYYLKSVLKNKIYFHEDLIDSDTKNKVSFLKKGEIILLENIRFNSGEQKDEDRLAKDLSSLGDIYINDAFSVSHRKQTSVHKITKYLKNSYAGPSVKKEIESFNLILSNKKKPVTCVIGGAKISTKIGVLTSLIKKIDNLIVVGAMANNFIKHNKNEVGKSLIEKGSEKYIEEINILSKKNSCNITIPKDVVISDEKKVRAEVKKLKDIASDDIIFDIGPNTIKIITDIIDKSKTIVWNGPAGYFENKNFTNGTVSIAKHISKKTTENSLISIVGGGDTISALKNNDLNLNFTHLSTAGGAFLEYLEGKNLPGIEVLK